MSQNTEAGLRLLKVVGLGIVFVVLGAFALIALIGIAGMLVGHGNSL